MDASSARQEILQLCEGMHAVVLPMGTSAEVGSPQLLPLR